MTLNIDKITKTISEFLVYHSVDCAKIEELQVEDPSAAEKLSIITVMEKIKAKVIEK